MRRNYWSCSEFADWLRGTAKPSSGTFRDWDIWEVRAATAYPVRYWLADTGLDYVQKAVYWPIDKIYDIKYYINNRWVSRTHSLTAHPRDIKPGQWQDVGSRILPCLFNELVDFVEIETAGNRIAWADGEDAKKYNAPFYASGWFRWRVWRCPAAGLDQLEWASKLIIGEDFGITADDESFGKPTQQAIRAMELIELYKWWTEVYPYRKDPHELSGWTAWCEERRKVRKEQFPDEKRSAWLLDRNEETTAEQAESSRILNLCTAIEQEQTDEDTTMMCRLIKARDSLWT